MRVLGVVVIWACIEVAIAQSPSERPDAAQGQPSEEVSINTDPSGEINLPAWAFPVEGFDRRLPRWLQLGGEYRTRVESQDGIGYTRARDFYILSRLRLNLTIQPVRWLKLFGETQDSRVFLNRHISTALPYQDTWDIRQAYIELGGAQEGWVDLIVGRQVFAFGDERVIGPSDWINMGRTFDALRLDLHHGGAKVSLFASSVIVGRDGEISHHIQGNNLYGVYGSLKNVVPRATVEPYVLWRLAPANAGLVETAGRGHLSEVTPGLHVTGSLPVGFDYNVEMDLQRGSLGTDSIRAWAGYWNLGRTFSSLTTSPRLFIESNYASGTKNPNGRIWSTFDQIYPSSHDKLDFADQVGRRNIQQIRCGGQETIGKRWKLTQAYVDLWLATTHDALYGSSGGISIPAAPTAKSRHIGQEIDLIAEYQASSGLHAGFGYTRLFSAQFLRTTTQGKDFTYPFIYLTYSFHQ
jgi:hypothetical protein